MNKLKISEAVQQTIMAFFCGKDLTQTKGAVDLDDEDEGVCTVLTATSSKVEHLDWI